MRGLALMLVALSALGAQGPARGDKTPRSFVAEAERLCKTGKRDGALALAEEARRRLPDARGWRVAAAVYDVCGRPKQAADAYRRLIDLTEDRSMRELRALELARYLEAHGARKEARDAYQLALREASTEERKEQARERIQAIREPEAASRADMEKLRRGVARIQGASLGGNMRNLVRRLLPRRGKPVQLKALQGLIEEKLKGAPRDVALLYALSQVESARGESRAAVNTLRGALQIEPREPYLLRLLADRYVEMGEFGKAVECHKRLLGERRWDRTSQYYLAYVYAQAGDKKSALKWAREYSRGGEPTASSYYGMARRAVLGGHVALAIEFGEGALRQYDPPRTHYLVWMLRLYRRVNRRADANRLSLRILGREDADERTLRGVMQHVLSDAATPEHAREWLRSLRRDLAKPDKLTPRARGARYGVLAEVFRLQDRLGEAVKAYRKAEKLAPNVKALSRRRKETELLLAERGSQLKGALQTAPDAIRVRDTSRPDLIWVAAPNTIIRADSRSGEATVWERLFAERRFRPLGIRFASKEVRVRTTAGTLRYDRKGGYWERLPGGGRGTP